MPPLEGESKTLTNTRESIPRPRIETLSDMIFGLALSLGAFSVLTQKPGDTLDILYSLVSFGFVFYALALVWLRYSRIMSVLPIESPGIVAVNMILLFLVTVEPYLFNLMTISAYSPSPGQLNSASTTALYALDMGALLFILAYFMHELTVEEKHLIPRELIRKYRLDMDTTILRAAIFVISALPIFWTIVVIQAPTVPLRYLLWCGFFVVSMGRWLDGKTAGQKSKSP